MVASIIGSLPHTRNKCWARRGSGFLPAEGASGTITRPSAGMNGTGWKNIPSSAPSRPSLGARPGPDGLGSFTTGGSGPSGRNRGNRSADRRGEVSPVSFLPPVAGPQGLLQRSRGLRHGGYALLRPPRQRRCVGEPLPVQAGWKGKPSFVSGVPPDYFSRTGQLWGNPVYDWDALRKSRYAWWVSRVRHNLKLFDLVRIDHCRGLVAYWEVPARNRTAVKGKWVPVPAGDFFRTLARKIPQGSLVAEDLGFITPEVRAMLDGLGLPGMRVFCLPSIPGPGRSIMPLTTTSSGISSIRGPTTTTPSGAGLKRR